MSYVAAASAAVSVGVGIAQYAKGRKEAKNNIAPKYEIPAEIQQNLSQAQMAALEGLPPAQKDQYIQNLQRQQNFGLQALGDRKAGISGLAALTQQGTDAYGNLLTADAQARQENQGKLMDARSQMAGFKDQAFQLNKLTPYTEKANAANALQGSGMQNIMGGLSGIAGAAETNTLANAYKEGNGNNGKTIDNALGNFGGAKQTSTELLGNNSVSQTSSLQQFQVAKMANPLLTYDQWLKTNGGTMKKGLGFMNNMITK